MGTTYRRAAGARSRQLKLAMLAATALAVVTTGFANAAPVGILDSPAPIYYNAVSAGYDGTDYGSPLPATNPTPGLVLDGNKPGLTPPTYFAVATGNYYNIPYISASVTVDGNVTANADSQLYYYIEFSKLGGGTTSLPVQAYAEVSAPLGDDSGHADAYLKIINTNTYDEAADVTVVSEYPDKGKKKSLFNQTLTFQDNVVYRVYMEAHVSAAAYLSPSDHSLAYAVVDPYFDLSNLPNGVTFLESNGIGNSLPNATPLPAALPLFASGLGGFAYLARRRRRKIAFAA